ncbi:MAG: hypothetical protein ACI8RD_013185, partial [Bacillariaceae sp.]
AKIFFSLQATTIAVASSIAQAERLTLKQSF